MGQGTRKSKMGTFVVPYQSNVHQTIAFSKKGIFFKKPRRVASRQWICLKDPYMQKIFSAKFTKFNYHIIFEIGFFPKVSVFEN